MSYYAKCYNALINGQSTICHDGRTINIDTSDFMVDGSADDYTESEFVDMCLYCFGEPTI